MERSGKKIPEVIVNFLKRCARSSNYAQDCFNVIFCRTFIDRTIKSPCVCSVRPANNQAIAVAHVKEEWARRFFFLHISDKQLSFNSGSWLSVSCQIIWRGNWLLQHYSSTQANWSNYTSPFVVIIALRKNQKKYHTVQCFYAENPIVFSWKRFIFINAVYKLVCKDWSSLRRGILTKL